LVAAIKLQPAYATLLRSKDMATWTALKARQEAAMAPVKQLVETMAAAGIPLEVVTANTGSWATGDGAVTADGAVGSNAVPEPALNLNTVVIRDNWREDAAKADAAYKAGIKQVKDVMKRAGGALREFPSA
jgi:hypothetical protein